MSKKGTSNTSNSKSSGKGGGKTAIPNRPGGNWPAKTDNPSGKGRGNAAPKK